MKMRKILRVVTCDAHTILDPTLYNNYMGTARIPYTYNERHIPLYVVPCWVQSVVGPTPGTFIPDIASINALSVPSIIASSSGFKHIMPVTPFIPDLSDCEYHSFIREAGSHYVYSNIQPAQNPSPGSSGLVDRYFLFLYEII